MPSFPSIPDPLRDNADSVQSTLLALKQAVELLQRTTAPAIRTDYNNVVNFGADPTGARDSLNAFVAAGQRSGQVDIPPGRYTLSDRWQINQFNTDIRGRRGLTQL